MTIENRIKAIEQLRRKSRESLAEAHLLNKSGFHGGAISRCYYSMFYLVQAVLATKDISRKKHSGVIAAFAQHFTNVGLLPKKLHTIILHIFKERQVSDYLFEVTKSAGDAKQVFALADEFVKEIEAYIDSWLKENR